MKHDELPPAATAAERYCLGCLIRFPYDAGQVFERLKKADFVDERHQLIFDKAAQQFVAGGIDQVLLGRQTKLPAYLVELGSEVATFAHLPVEAAKITEARRKRQLHAIAGDVRRATQNGHSADDIVRTLLADIEDIARERDTTDKPRFRTYTAAELDQAEFPVNFLIKNIVVAGMPCGVGGPEKALKTTTLLALGVSLNLVEPFLGMFEVPAPKRFLMFSGESGMPTLQETARRICHSYGCELSDLGDGFIVSPDLPEVSNAIDIREMEAIIADNAPDVVAIDPMYLCLGDIDEKAANMFTMGRQLAKLNEACKRHNPNTTLMFAHHFNSTIKYADTPKVTHFAFSGFKQFLRQWILFNRMEEYTPGTGLHRLKMAVGGSVGHGGLWFVEIDEGTRYSLGGRHWQATVKSIDDAKQESSTRAVEIKAEAAERRLTAERQAACDVLAKHPDGMASTTLREHSGISGSRWTVVLAALLRLGNVVECEIIGGHPPKPMKGYKLADAKV